MKRYAVPALLVLAVVGSLAAGGAFEVDINPSPRLRPVVAVDGGAP